MGETSAAANADRGANVYCQLCLDTNSDLEHDKDCPKWSQAELGKLSQVASITKTCL